MEKGKKRFGCNQSGECHREAQMKLRNVMHVPSVAAELVLQAKSAHQVMLLRQLSSLKFLLRQSMAI